MCNAAAVSHHSMRATRCNGVCICNVSKAERARVLMRILPRPIQALPMLSTKIVGKLCTTSAGGIRPDAARKQDRERDPQRTVSVNSNPFNVTSYRGSCSIWNGLKPFSWHTHRRAGADRLSSTAGSACDRGFGLSAASERQDRQCPAEGRRAAPVCWPCLSAGTDTMF